MLYSLFYILNLHIRFLQAKRVIFTVRHEASILARLAYLKSQSPQKEDFTLFLPPNLWLTVLAYICFALNDKKALLLCWLFEVGSPSSTFCHGQCSRNQAKAVFKSAHSHETMSLCSAQIHSIVGSPRCTSRYLSNLESLWKSLSNFKLTMNSKRDILN